MADDSEFHAWLKRGVEAGVLPAGAEWRPCSEEFAPPVVTTPQPMRSVMESLAPENDAGAAILRSYVDTERRHNATCPRCYGPAYQGLGALRCERVGGCLADVDPTGQAWCRASMHQERYFWHEANPSLRYATRELAVAAWREAVIAKAEREAGAVTIVDMREHIERANRVEFVLLRMYHLRAVATRMLIGG